jgi:hypothetical protein
MRKPKKTLTPAEIDARRSEAFFQMEEPLRDAAIIPRSLEHCSAMAVRICALSSFGNSRKSSSP